MIIKKVDTVDDIIPELVTTDDFTFVVAEDESQLAFYLHGPTNNYNWCKHIVTKLRNWLLQKGLDSSLIKSELYIYDLPVLNYRETILTTHSEGLIEFYLPNSLANYGLANFEIKELILDNTFKYLELTNT